MMKKLILGLMFCLFSGNGFAEVKLVDGDSLEINGQRTRLDGIDAPEYWQICSDAKGQEYPCGQEALNYITKLVGKQTPDCHCLEHTDKYGRKICECYLKDKSINAEMVASGWAQTYRSDKFNIQENQAKSENKGIWQGKHIHPALFRALSRKMKNNQQKNSPSALF